LDDLEGAVEDQDQPEDGGEREEGVDRPDEPEGCANSDVTVACWFLSDGSSVR
jgi:hypothetical protein